MDYQAYTTALLEQINVHSHLLDQLSDQQDPLNLLERTAAERSLQILLEGLIGCAKHLNKKANLPSRSDAFQAVQQASEQFASQTSGYRRKAGMTTTPSCRA